MHLIWIYIKWCVNCAPPTCHTSFNKNMGPSFYSSPLTTVESIRDVPPSLLSNLSPASRFKQYPEQTGVLKMTLFINAAFSVAFE